MVNEKFVKNTETGEMELVESIVIDESQLIDELVSSKEDELLKMYQDLQDLKAKQNQ